MFTKTVNVLESFLLLAYRLNTIRVQAVQSSKRIPAMFFSLDTSTQLFLFTTVVIMTYFIASAMHGVMGPDGFGVLGNQGIIIAGFYLGIWGGRYFHFPVRDFTNAVIAGLAGAFIALFFLTVLKALLNRFA